MLVIEESFQLPLEERKAYEQLPGSAEGYGQTFVISEEQILDRGDMYFLSNKTVSGRIMKLWPTDPPKFKWTSSSPYYRKTDFLMNIGDIIEIMSNGKYKSIEHWATVNTDWERMLIATFHSPIADAQVGPLPQTVEKNKPQYKTISLHDYIKIVFSFKLEGKNILDHMKLEA